MVSWVTRDAATGAISLSRHTLATEFLTEPAFTLLELPILVAVDTSIHTGTCIFPLEQSQKLTRTDRR